MNEVIRTCRCSICDKTIKYKLPKNTDKIREKRICLECAFYEIKAVKVLILVIGLIGVIIFTLDLFNFDFLENRIYKISSLIGSGLLVILGVVYYLILPFLKLLRKKISFKYKK